MALTRDFRETVQARARRDPAYRRALLREAVELMLGGDLETGKLVLRNYINATKGFRALGAATHKSAKSLMRMFSASGNPRASNVFQVLGYLQTNEGIRFKLTAGGIFKARARASRKRIARRAHAATPAAEERLR